MSGLSGFLGRAGSLLMLGAALSAQATTYYIDYVGGNDANNGTSKATPWKRHPYMGNFGGTYGHANGDRFIFKGGVTWPVSELPIGWVGGGGYGVGSSSSSNPDYYGIDQTWYTGSSWSKPIMNLGGQAQCFLWLVDKNNITVEGFDITNIGQYGSVINVYRSTGMKIKDCIFHNFVTSGFSADALKCINGDSSQPYSGNLIDGCVFTGSPGAVNCGMAVYHWSGDIINSYATNLSNGFLPNMGTVSNCVVGPINDCFDVNQHENSIEQVGGGRMDICNNVLRNPTAVCIFTGNPGGPTYVYNNLIVYNGVSAPPIPIQFDGRGGSFNAYVYNNTVISTGAGSSSRCVGAATVTLTAYNNHWIDGTISSGGFASVTEGNALSQTMAQANAAGYTLANNFKPTSASSPTVDAGRVIALFNKDLLLVDRPQGSLWDIGTYEFAGTLSTPVVQVTPTSYNFGSIPVGSTSNVTFTVRNAGGGTLSGTASAGGDYSIVSGSPYNIASNATTSVVVRYAPSAAGGSSQNISFTGGGGATVPVSGSAWSVLSGSSWYATNGVVTSPFATNVDGSISQPSLTGVADGGRLIIGFNVASAGNYNLSVLLDAPNTSSDSFFVCMDAADPVDPTEIWDVIPTTTGFQTRLVSRRGTGTFDAPQDSVRTFNLSAGTHQLQIVGREGNAKLLQVSLIAAGGVVVPNAPTGFTISAP